MMSYYTSWFHVRRCTGVYFIGLCLLVVVAQGSEAHQALAGAGWFDTRRPIRIPVTFEVDKAGPVELAISPGEVTAAINRVEEFGFAPRHFAYSEIQLVDVTDGSPRPLKDWRFVGQLGLERVRNGGFEEQDDNGIAREWICSMPSGFELRTEDGGHYLHASGADMNNYHQGPYAVTPNHDYVMRFRERGRSAVNVGTFEGTGGGWKALKGSYIPTVPRRDRWVRHRFLFNAGARDKVFIRVLRYTADTDDVSLRAMTVHLRGTVATPGRKRWLLYYTPTEGSRPHVPATLSEAPLEPAAVIKPKIGPAERYDESVVYRVASRSDCAVWYAHNIRKITATSHPPAQHHDAIALTAARNEKESFQLVLRANRDGVLVSNLTTTALTHSTGQTIGAENITVRRAAYVPCLEPSGAVRSVFTGRVADPLVPFSPTTLHRDSPNLTAWLTISVPKTARAGSYRGQVTVNFADNRNVAIPLSLHVYDFTLPDVSAFRSSFGGQHFLIRYRGHRSIFDFHGIVEKSDQQKLVRRYHDVLADCRLAPFYPSFLHGWSKRQTFEHTIAQYAGKDWKGLADQAFDFTDFDAIMTHLLDERHLNAFGIDHTNGDLIAKMNDEDFEKLVQSYRLIAAHLEEKGWLDKAYILVDESSRASLPMLRRYCETLKRDPLTARLRVCFTIDKIHPFTEPDPANPGRRLLQDMIDIWTPENNEAFNFYEPEVFSDYDNTPREVWLYYTRTAHFNIDAPGLSNRLLPLKVWHCGGTGFLTWGSWIWDHPFFKQTDGPWRDPSTPWGNGAVGFFYPPKPDGPTEQPDFTVTPALRLELYREGIEDFEYVRLLQRRIANARHRGKDAASAETLLTEAHAMFLTPVHWRLAEHAFLRWRDGVAVEIERLGRFTLPR